MKLFLFILVVILLGAGDVVEDTIEDVKEKAATVKRRTKRVVEEVKDVVKEVKDVADAVKGKKRRGRKPKNKK